MRLSALIISGLALTAVISGVHAADKYCFIWPGHVINELSRPAHTVTKTASAKSPRPWKGSNIVVTIAQHDAGSISSVIWDGVEYVNDWGNGRQWQSAVFFDGKGECDNPTESGTANDWAGSQATSVLESMSVFGNEIYTSVLAADFRDKNFVGPSCHGFRQAYGEYLTKTYINKHITIGAQPYPANVIKWDVDFVLTQAKISALFQSQVAFVPGTTFTRWYWMDPIAQTTTEVFPAQGVFLNAPLIRTGGPTAFYINCDSGATHCLGMIILHNDLVQANTIRATQDFREDGNKVTDNAPQFPLSRLARLPGVYSGDFAALSPSLTSPPYLPIGTYMFHDTYAIIGSLDDVSASMQTLWDNF